MAVAEELKTQYEAFLETIEVNLDQECIVGPYSNLCRSILVSEDKYSGSLRTWDLVCYELPWYPYFRGVHCVRGSTNYCSVYYNIVLCYTCNSLKMAKLP